MNNDLSVIAKHWAIEPDVLKTITLKDPIAGLSLFDERPLINTRMASERDGVAIIPIQGVITPRADLFTILMNGTPLDLLAKDLHAAVSNPSIHAILLDIDSPGGVAVGQSEMAEIIRRANSIKPVWAYVGRNCCSAAYWLASAVGKIIAHKSSILGSIGVVSTIPVQEATDQDGVRQIEIVSSNAKNKRPDPRTPEGMDVIRGELDALEAEFIRSVATYRNLSEDAIKRDFGQGGTLIGSAALNVEMVDALSNYETTITDLIKQTKKGEPTMESKEIQAITPEETERMNTPQAALLAASGGVSREVTRQPAQSSRTITEREIAAYREEGARAERERLLALDEIATAGYEALLAKAKADPTMTAEKLALEIVRTEKAKGNEYIESLRTAEKTLPEISPVAKPQFTGATPIERAEHEWNTKAEIRKEFIGDKEAFVAFFIAQENGQIKIQNKGE